MVQTEHFYAKFDEKWKVVGTCDRTKGYKTKGSKLGNT